MTLKKSKERKKKPTKRRTLIKNLDMYFSRYIRWYHADPDGLVKCVTCSTKKHVKKMQNGHFISRRHYSTRWLFTNCFAQCYSCNIGSQGMQWEFGKYIDRVYGIGTAQLVSDRSKMSRKFTDHELKVLTQVYKNKADELHN